MKRRRPIHLFGNRIAEGKEKARSSGRRAGVGPERKDLLKKIRQLDIRYNIDEWRFSSGLQVSR